MNILRFAKGKVREITQRIPTVEEIHAEVYSIHDTLLMEAEQTSKEILNDNERKALAKNLYDLGFYGANNIGPAINALSKLEVLQMYQNEYPTHKFIDEKSVEAICKKYGFYLCNVRDFISDIPVKNQREIIAFRVKEKHLQNRIRFNHPYYRFHGELSQEDKEALKRETLEYEQKVMTADKSEALVAAFGLKIIAPESQINMQFKEKLGYQIVQKDPIVLQPVKDGYLIVTAWGDEASDELVVNQKMN